MVQQAKWQPSAATDSRARFIFCVIPLAMRLTVSLLLLLLLLLLGAPPPYQLCWLIFPLPELWGEGGGGGGGG